MNYISTKDAAILSGVSQRYIRRLIKEKKVGTCIKIGICWAIPHKSFMEYMKKKNNLNYH